MRGCKVIFHTHLEIVDQTILSFTFITVDNAVLSTMLVAVEDCWELTVTVQLTPTTLVVVEVCWPHVRLTSALHVCDTEHRMLAVR